MTAPQADTCSTRRPDRKLQGRQEVSHKAEPQSKPGWFTTGTRTGRGSRTGHARRYLYELITGCSLHTAPPPYQLDAQPAGIEYGEFAITITASLAGALHDHARSLLESWGIDGEPLQWQPPANWVSVTTWPGADPADADPSPVHQALLQGDMPVTGVASSLGISADHMRQILRHHPLRMPLRPVRRRLYPQAQQPAPHLAQNPDAIRIDLDWLREQYLTWHRTLADIAAEADCTTAALKMKTPARCLGKTAPRTPQAAMITPPAPASGAAALLAASKVASLRIVDGVRTPTAELRDMRPCRNRMANHKMTKPARTSAITGTSIAATSINKATREGRQRAADIRAIPEQSPLGTSDDRGKDRYRAPTCSAPPSSHPFLQETPDKKPTQRTSSRNPYTIVTGG